MKSTEGKTTDIRTIFKTEEFEAFYDSLDERVKGKNGFLKKSTKDYDRQIAKAVRILKNLAL